MCDDTIMAGVNFNDIGKGKTKITKIINIVQVFNTTIIRILKISLVKLSDSPQLQSAKRLILLATKNNPDLMIKLSYKNLLDENVSNAICDSNIEFFMNQDYSTDVIKMGNKKMQYFLIDAIKQDFSEWSESEQNQIWELANILVFCSSLYDMLC
jgi:hypothetical protein